MGADEMDTRRKKLLHPLDDFGFDASDVRNNAAPFDAWQKRCCHRHDGIDRRAKNHEIRSRRKIGFTQKIAVDDSSVFRLAKISLAAPVTDDFVHEPTPTHV